MNLQETEVQLEVLLEALLDEVPGASTDAGPGKVHPGIANRVFIHRKWAGKNISLYGIVSADKFLWTCPGMGFWVL